MHIIVIAIVLFGAAYVLTKLLGARQNPLETGARVQNLPFHQPADSRGPGIAFIAEGNLFYQASGRPIEQIHSPYVQEAQDKVARSNERNAWKKGTSFEIAANQGMRQFGSSESQIVNTSVCFDQQNRLVYFLRDAAMGGLFSYDVASKTEQRLLHRQNLCLNDLCIQPGSDRILASSSYDNGVANLALLELDGSGYRELTSGDTVDAAPVWIPGPHQQIIYQSTGIARQSGNGYIVAHSPVALHMLDMQSREISTVMEDERFDFLMPRFDKQGNLLFIRRPYETPKYSTENILLDTLLFPFRLLRAVFHYLNFFSIMYTRKPLSSASGPARQADLKQILLKGKRIDAEKALRKEAAINGIASLVPQSWQLICRTQQGQETVLARNVASYDVTSQGDIIYSNGRAVFGLDANNHSRLLLKSDLVGDIVSEKAAEVSA